MEVAENDKNVSISEIVANTSSSLLQSFSNSLLPQVRNNTSASSYILKVFQNFAKPFGLKHLISTTPNMQSILIKIHLNPIF